MLTKMFFGVVFKGKNSKTWRMYQKIHHSPPGPNGDPIVHIFSGRIKQCLGGNVCTNSENMQTPHREAIGSSLIRSLYRA